MCCPNSDLNPKCCDRKARAASAQNVTLWQKPEITFVVTAVVTISKYDQVFTRFTSILLEVALSGSLYYCSLHIGAILSAHPPRCESRIQPRANGVIARTFPPCNESHLPFVKVAPCMDFTSWSQTHFVTIGKPARQARKASGSKQQ